MNIKTIENNFPQDVANCYVGCYKKEYWTEKEIPKYLDQTLNFYGFYSLDKQIQENLLKICKNFLYDWMYDDFKNYLLNK